MTESKKLLTYRDLSRLKGINYSRQHLARLEKAGEFPQRIRLSPGRVGWFDSELDYWLQSKASARHHRAPGSRPAQLDVGGETGGNNVTVQPSTSSFSCLKPEKASRTSARG